MSSLFRHADGVWPNTAALSFTVFGWPLGIALLGQAHWALNALGVLLVTLTLTWSAYFIHEFAHQAIFKTPLANQRWGTFMSWINGSAYASFDDLRRKHMRHHVERADVITFDLQGFLRAHPLVKRVVLALPFTRLRAVKGLGGLGLSADKMKVINEQGYGANAKLVVGTSSRPWTSALPDLRAPMTGSLYSDKGFQQIWENSIGQPGDGGVLTNYLAGPPARSEEATVLATLERGLKALSPEFASSLSPRMRASFFWASHPHTRGSYSGALAGQYTSFSEIAARSELGGGLAFAGEHTSVSWAGSMNGAVDAGERVARELLAQG